MLRARASVFVNAPQPTANETDAILLNALPVRRLPNRIECVRYETHTHVRNLLTSSRVCVCERTAMPEWNGTLADLNNEV